MGSSFRSRFNAAAPHWTPLPFTPGGEGTHIRQSSWREQAAQLAEASVHHILALLHMLQPGILSWVFIASSSRFLTKTSLQWVLMELVGSVPRLPEREKGLELCGWLLIKHDLASISSVILGLIFDDTPHFAFLGPFHLFKRLLRCWSDNCNSDWRTLVWLLSCGLVPSVTRGWGGGGGFLALEPKSMFHSCGRLVLEGLWPVSYSIYTTFQSWVHADTRVGDRGENTFSAETQPSKDRMYH